MRDVKEMAQRLNGRLSELSIDEINSSSELSETLSYLFISLMKKLGFQPLQVRYDGFLETRVGEGAIHLLQFVPSRGMEVSILKCREKGCDKGLQIKIQDDKLLLTCETHGDWEIGNAKKV